MSYNNKINLFSISSWVLRNRKIYLQKMEEFISSFEQDYECPTEYRESKNGNRMVTAIHARIVAS